MIQDKQIYIPPSLSPEAQELLKSLAESKTYKIEVPGPDDLAGWQKAHALGEQFKRKKPNRPWRPARRPPPISSWAACPSWISARKAGTTTARWWCTSTVGGTPC